MKELVVKCPQCKALCGINLVMSDLVEGYTSTFKDVFCNKCECRFSFDVYVDVLNKKENE